MHQNKPKTNHQTAKLSKFLSANRVFVLSFKNNTDRTGHKPCYLPKVEIKDYLLRLMVQTFLINLLKIISEHKETLKKSLLIIEYYKLIAIDLSTQQALDANPKAIQKINLTGNLDLARSATMYFNIKEVKETNLDFSLETVRVLWFYFIIVNSFLI